MFIHGKKLLALLIVFTALTGVGQSWGMEKECKPTLGFFARSIVKGFCEGLILGTAQSYLCDKGELFQDMPWLGDIAFSGIGYGAIVYNCLSKQGAIEPLTPIFTALGYVLGRYHHEEF